MYLYISLYISIYLYISLYISIYLYISLYISIYIYLYIYISIYLYISLYISLCISMYLYISLYISIYLYISCLAGLKEYSGRVHKHSFLRSRFKGMSLALFFFSLSLSLLSLSTRARSPASSSTPFSSYLLLSRCLSEYMQSSLLWKGRRGQRGNVANRTVATQAISSYPWDIYSILTKGYCIYQLNLDFSRKIPPSWIYSQINKIEEQIHINASKELLQQCYCYPRNSRAKVKGITEGHSTTCRWKSYSRLPCLR